MLRYARYAAAAFFALLAVAFVGSWWRSHYWYDTITCDALSNHFEITSARGVLLCVTYPEPLPGRLGLTWTSSLMNEWLALDRQAGLCGVLLSIQQTYQAMAVAHWFLTASSLALAALFAFKRTWRYSLRTILVATTILAGLLGLAVWAM
jgi:hypothetical protein